MRNRHWRKEIQREQTEEPEVLERSSGKKTETKDQRRHYHFHDIWRFDNLFIDHRHEASRDKRR
jgi:hypothetical protein